VPIKKGRGICPRPKLKQRSQKQSPYCTFRLKDDELTEVGPSVAVTMIGYVFGTDVGVMVTVAVATLVVSACEVAVMVALPGRPSAAVGAVYTPPAVMDPPLVVVTAHVTAVLVVLDTVAVKVAV
jgi:hypothetical protein